MLHADHRLITVSRAYPLSGGQPGVESRKNFAGYEREELVVSPEGGLKPQRRRRFVFERQARGRPDKPALLEIIAPDAALDGHAGRRPPGGLCIRGGIHAPGTPVEHFLLVEVGVQTQCQES